ncbi:MAG TPA: zf-HC2 domain-containing protein [Thermoanaerobaculia bacterium]|jgi:hypothetical protein|nr:zf-HC2 domain-containing protein [Thermoanaerobaculia bacterium]
MLETTDCSAPEDLAALAEGRLRGQERDRVIAHLAGCADCREVFAGIVETAEELDREDQPSVIAPLPQKKRFGWPARSAAAAMLGAMAVGAVALWQVNAQRHPPSPTEWLAQMPPATELAPLTWGGVTLRGLGAAGELYPQSVELGALIVDLHTAVQARDGERARNVLERMAVILDDAGLMEKDPATLRSVAELRDADRMRDALAKSLPGIEQRIHQRFAPSFLDFGTFVEEVHVAASAGDQRFIESRSARRYLDWVLSRPNLALPAVEGRPVPLGDEVGAALRIVQRQGATQKQQADAAEDILHATTR